MLEGGPAAGLAVSRGMRDSENEPDSTLAARTSDRFKHAHRLRSLAERVNDQALALLVPVAAEP
jgi:hypothetical protein